MSPSKCRSPKLRRAESSKRTTPTKRQRPQHPDTWKPSPQFWDALPKVFLTRRALIENDRRIRQNMKSQAPTEASTTAPLRRSARLLARKSRASLTSLASNGGLDLSSIRGYPDPTMNHENQQRSRATRPSRSTPSTQPVRSDNKTTTGPYDSNYEQALREVGIQTVEERDENDNIILPANYDEIVRRLDRPRHCLSSSQFTERDFQNHKRNARFESHEGGAMLMVEIIAGSEGNFPNHKGGVFNKLEPFTTDLDLDLELAMAVPDWYDRAEPASIDHRARQDLDQYIVPSTTTSRPALPNFFLEAKSNRGIPAVAKLQAAHNGAIGARGMMEMQKYSGASLYDNKATTFTATYNDGVLKLYTTHVTAPRTRKQEPQYYMTQVGGYDMTMDADMFRRGATRYQNARELAAEMRDAVIQQANDMA